MRKGDENKYIIIGYIFNICFSFLKLLVCTLFLATSLHHENSFCFECVGHRWLLTVLENKYLVLSRLCIILRSGIYYILSYYQKCNPTNWFFSVQIISFLNIWRAQEYLKYTFTLFDLLNKYVYNLCNHNIDISQSSSVLVV